MMISRQKHGFSAAAAVVVWAMVAAPAEAGSTLYDLSVFLDAPSASSAPTADKHGGSSVSELAAPIGTGDNGTLALIPPPPVPGVAERAMGQADFGTGFAVSGTQTELADSTDSAPRQVAQAALPAATGDTASIGIRRSDLSRGGGIVSEIRAGLAAHDVGPFTLDTQREDGTWNLNGEIIFHSPAFLDIIGSPRPHLGAQVNLAGETSQVYAGLSYEWYLVDRLFAGVHGGGAYHNGETTGAPAGRKNLGCELLFRGAVEVGYRIDDRHGLSVMLDHISNAELCSANEGLETVALRYGYRF